MGRSNIVYSSLSYEIIGAAMEVHRQLGPGFLESIYERALTIELESRMLAVDRQRRMTVTYKNQEIGRYVADLVVENRVILELKNSPQVHTVHRTQTLNYLAVSGLELGIVLCFGGTSLQSSRVVKQSNRPKNSRNSRNSLRRSRNSR